MKFGFRQLWAPVVVLLALTGNASAESLTTALAKAYKNNPAMAAALLSVKLATEDIALRQVGKRPQLRLGATSGYDWAFVGGTTTHNQSNSVNLSYNQTLFDGLKTDAQIDQARAMAKSAQHGLRNSEQNVLLSAAIAYLDVVRDRKLAKLRADNVSFLRAQVSSAKNRLQLGEGTKIDVAQAEARLAQSVANYKSAVNSLGTSQAAYARWVGESPPELKPGFEFNGLLPTAPDAALQAARANHPAVKMAQAQLNAARSGSDAAQRAFNPTLDLVGSICTLDCGPTTRTTASVKLTLSVPIYSGGALGASARKANLSFIQAELGVRETLDRIEAAAVSAWSGLQSSIALIEAAQAAVRSTQIALDGMIEEQNVGQRTTLDVLNARAELTTARETLYNAQRNRLVASFSLMAAIGKLDAVALGLPVEIETGEGYRARVIDIWGELAR